MASSSWSLVGIIFSALLIISMAMAMAMAAAAAGREFKVGDDYGWQQPPPNDTAFYIQWAETNRFHVSDSLVFEYENDSVLTVEKWDYYHCDASDPITAFDNGKSRIHLDRPGPFFFISGSHDHCINGQRLIVDVMSPHPVNPASPPSIAPAPPPEAQPQQDQAFSQMAPSPSSLHSSVSGVSTSSVSLPLLATSVVLISLGINGF